MGDIVNLRRARKQKARVAAANDAAAKRIEFGQSPQARVAESEARALELSRLEAHRREGRGSEDHE